MHERIHYMYNRECIYKKKAQDIRIAASEWPNHILQIIPNETIE